MDRKELDDISRFLQTVGKADLYAYYGVRPDCDLEELDGTVKKKRKWAQGQQSNPKFKSEALFLIKNHGALTRLLLEDGSAYRESLKTAMPTAAETFAEYVRAAVAGGILAPAQEAALVAKGRELGLVDAVIHPQIARILHETGARREAPDEVSLESAAVDHYKVLGVAPGATVQEIDLAYNEKYRWARNLKDLRQSSEVMAALDEASRTLKNPERRALYDERRKLIESLNELNSTTGVFDFGAKRPAPPPNLVQNHMNAQSAAREAEKPSPADPFADKERPSEKVLVPDDEDTVVRDPFGPGGSLNPTINWRPTVEESVDEPEVPGERSFSRPEVPPPPIGLQAPTLGVSESPQMVRTQVPRLTVDGPTRYTLENPTAPTNIQVKIRNEGAGRMPGRITFRGDWLELSSTTLNPDLAEQVVTVTIQPANLPGGSSVATIRIAGEHGEVRDVTIQVNRPERIASRRNLLIGAALLLVVAVVGGAGFWWSQRDTGPPVDVNLKIVPYADQVVVVNSDGSKVEGTGSQVHLTRPSKSSSKVEVTTAGFQKLVVSVDPSDQPVQKTLLLVPDIEMDHGPAANHGPNKYEPDVASPVRTHATELGKCFQGTGVVRPRFTTWIADSGFVMWVDMDRASKDRADTACINRIFRGMRFPDMQKQGQEAVVSTSGIDLPAGP